MPKIKTIKGVAKRFKKSAGGLKYRHAFTGHNFGGKSMKQKRKLRGRNFLSAQPARVVKKLPVH